MLGFIRNGWSVAGVNTTLTSAGLSKAVARNITSSLSGEHWGLMRNCTKDLNKQCENLCNSMYAVALFQYLNDDNIDYRLDTKLFSVMRNLLDSVEYQGAMGYQSALDESQRRFEYIAEKFFGGLIIEDNTDAEVTVPDAKVAVAKKIISSNRIENPIIEFKTVKQLRCLKCLSDFKGSRAFCVSCDTGNFVTEKL